MNALRRSVGESIEVLVVEDEARVARVIVAILERPGVDITVTGSLKSAQLALDAYGEFDVLVVDFILPDGDGLEFARRVHAERGCAIVLMSGLVEIPGAESFTTLAKPFTPDALEQAVADALVAARASR